MSGNSDISGDVSSTVNNSIIPDDMSDPSSSLDSPTGFEDSDLLSSSNVADVTAQLAAAGWYLFYIIFFTLINF